MCCKELRKSPEGKALAYSSALEMAEVSINFWPSAFQGKGSELGLEAPSLSALIVYDCIALVESS